MYVNWKEKIDEKELNIISKLIQDGQIIIFPTETVYGIGANAFDEKAVKKIFEAKGRPQDNPLIVHVSRKEQIYEITKNINEIEKKLIDNFMPGPFTLVLEKKDNIPNIVSAGLDTIGVRMPENEIAKAIIENSKVPIVAPSANISGKPSGTNLQDVFDELKDKVDCIIDGGNSNIGIESTVVKVENDEIFILRPGKITKERLEKITKCIVHEKINKENKKIESPGVKYTHYCPKCEMILVKNNIIENFTNLYKNYKDRRVLILCSPSTKKHLDIPCVILGKNSEEASKNIFNFLRKYENDYDLILAELITNGKMSKALYKRMIKSASGKEV